MTDVVPKVSVVIPAYHAEAFVAHAIQSVLDQQGVDPEIIVVVDGLVDRTADIARGFPKTRVVINEINQGAPAARNRGLALAQAPYVMFLDADDWVEGPLLQGLAEALDTLHADIAFGPCKTEHDLGQPDKLISLRAVTDEEPSNANNRDLIMFFLAGSFVNPCSTMWKANFLREQGGWNKNLARGQDFELVQRCLIRGAKAALTGKGCGVYYYHSGGNRISFNSSKQRWKSELTYVLYIIEEAKAAGCFDDSFKTSIISYINRKMRMLAQNADDNVFCEALQVLKELGVAPQHDGTVFHRLGCSLLGLRRKEQLALKISRVKKHCRNCRFTILTRTDAKQ